MKIAFCRAAIALILCQWTSHVTGQAQPAPSKPGQSTSTSEVKATTPAKTQSSEAPKIRFRPPAGIGAATGTVTGGTRGGSRELVLFLAAPYQVGLSASTQPDLYWYVSRPLAAPPEFTLVEANGTQALIERTLAVPLTAGFQRISLRELGIHLQEGREYLWQISLGSSVDRVVGHSLDASGLLRCVAPATTLSARIAAANNFSAAALYAEAGYWYDAVMRLRDSAGRSGGFSEPELGLFESAGLGQLMRRATEGSPSIH